MKNRSRRRWPWIALGAALLGLTVAVAMAAGLVRARRLRADLRQAQEAIDAGRWGLARKDLLDLDRRQPDEGEVLLLLGRCEEALGRPAQALAAWGRIPPTDASYALAAESRASVLMNQGRYAPAEACLLEAVTRASAADRYPPLRALARLYRLQGRYAEVSDALIAAWPSAPEPADLLQDLWQNDAEPEPIDARKVLLDAADPQDDRVWLGRARYAIATDRLADAESWLKRCLDRRPEDHAVWRARLDLAAATRDVDGFRAAARHIPADTLRPEDLAAHRAWLAEHLGDARASRRDLADLTRANPLDTQALQRLLTLAREAGDQEDAERLRRRKAEVDGAMHRMRKLVVRAIPFRQHAGELPAIMAVLGRNFDRDAWSCLSASPSSVPGAPSASSPALSRDRTACRALADAALARLLVEVRSPSHGKEGSLADRLADLDAKPAHEMARAPAPRQPDELAGARAHFTDDAEAAGLHFTFDNGQTPQYLLPETMSGGVALLDYDGDGRLDVYCVQGGSLSRRPGTGMPAPGSGDRLFRNRGDGSFEDVSGPTRIASIAGGLGYGMGVAVGDIDNDGKPDVFLTLWDRYALLRNRGDGTFEDITERSGLAGPRENPTSAAFADLDGDGDLDLYVCHYIRWDPEHPATCKNESGKPHYCDPAIYERAADHAYRNDGGRFVDVTEAAGFTDPDGRGLGVVAADLDDDGRIDLYVANDGTSNFLFHNRGGFRFEEIALTAGVAASGAGGYQAGMGVVAADFDGDGRLDLGVTNLYGEGTTLHQNLGQGLFTDRSVASGILPATRYLLGFGIAALDATNRGRPDLVITNGNVNDFRPFYPFAMPTRLYENRPDGRLVDISDRSGPPFAVPRLGRGLAAGDLDNDGRVDFVVMAQDGPLAYFHNRTEHPGHFVTLELEGTTSNRDGVGARVILTTAGRRQVEQRLGGGSYLSAADGRLHFGLGASKLVDSLEITWPSGRRDRWTNLPADAGYRLREGEASARPLGGFDPFIDHIRPLPAPSRRGHATGVFSIIPRMTSRAW